ncbi:MAG TPA: isocitrate lyase/PEP mutase family protein, partial [Burkholderiales bacterium]|nr:isocitrate lyase/PEP mutase family protein [Burkholderiales bacterium]
MARLKALLDAGEFVVAPGVFEMFSAKIADRMGFKGLYMTGYGISASHLGLADAGLVTYRDMVERARTIAQGTRTPLIADADTGFGGLLNVREAVRGYEAAGVEAIQIEDQEVPKKCGHTPDRRVVPLADAVKRIEVAVEARRSRDFLIVARTDARTGLGLDEALARAKAFAKAGADI